MSMGIELTPEVQNLVQGIYSRGQYASEAEVLSTALQLLKQRDQLRMELRQGIEELDRGERLPAQDVFAELRQRASGLDDRGT
jgi:Arc/MetJ-type ribon-helix-helix transcriptional regulator